MAAENTSEKEEGILRELGLHELFYETLSDRYNASHYFQYAVLNSNCCLTKEDIEESLRILINFQPFLRVKVVSRVDKTKPPTRKNKNSELHERLYYAECQIDLADVLRIRFRVTDDDLRDIVAEEEEFLSREERYGDGPRWRLVVNIPKENEPAHSVNNYKYEILFRFHHQFSDAVSGYDIVYRQFLPILNKTLNQEPVDDFFLKPLELTPTYEEDLLGVANSADKHPSWYIKSGLGLVRAVTRFRKGENSFRPPIFSDGAPFERAKGIGIVRHIFGKELVGNILHKRKEKDITVHSILLTGFSFGMVKLFEQMGFPLPKVIGSCWPIDSRKKLEKYHSPQPLGLFIGTNGLTSMKVPKPFVVNKETFWGRAKKMGNQVQKNVRDQHEKLVLDVMAYLTEMLQHESMGKLFSEIDVDQHFGLSNLGKCAPGTDMDASLPKQVDAEEIYFGLLGSGYPDLLSPFFTTVVNHKEQLFFVMLYIKRWVKEDVPETLFRFTEEVLNEMCSSSDSTGSHL